MPLFNKALRKQNKALKNRIAELEQELIDVKNESDEHRGILLDVVDSYLEDRHLYDDFKKFVHAPRVVNIGVHKNKTLNIWRELEL